MTSKQNEQRDAKDAVSGMALAMKNGKTIGEVIGELRTENSRLAAQNRALVDALGHIANHLEMAPKFAAVEYSDELLIPYSDIGKYARAALAAAREPQ